MWLDAALRIYDFLFSAENLSDLSLSLGYVWDTLQWSASSQGVTSWWTPVTFTTGSVLLQPSLKVSFIAHSTQCTLNRHEWLQATPTLKVAQHSWSYSLTKYTRVRIIQWPEASVRALTCYLVTMYKSEPEKT